MKAKFFVVANILSITLCACSTEGNEQKIPNVNGISVNTNIENSESVGIEQKADVSAYAENLTEQKTEEQANFDIQTMLEEAETQSTDLEKKLYEDTSLTQADMNVISYEIYMVWDELLNEVWTLLKQKLDEKTMDALLDEQRVWITEKEAEVKRVGEEAGGGSIAGLLCNQRAAQLTRTRVYELANYLGYDGTIPQINNSAEKIEEVSFQEMKTTMSFVVEGMEEEVPAIRFVGENYSITVPEEGWEIVAKGVWRSEVNNEVQISIVDYEGEDIDSVRESLSGSGYVENGSYYMRFEDKNGLVWNVRLFTKDEKVVGVFYDYPIEAVEGFGVRLPVIVDTFEWK